MNTAPLHNKTNSSSEDIIDFRKIIFKSLANWKWFVLSVFLCLGIAYLYIRYATPKYKVTARVLINDEKEGPGGLGSLGKDAMGGLGGLLGGGSSTVDNEVEMMKTWSLLERVAKELNLNVTYYTDGRVNSSEVYLAPFVVKVLELEKKAEGAKIEINLLSNNRIALKTGDLDTVMNLNSSLKIPKLGTIQILQNKEVPVEHRNYHVTISAMEDKVDQLVNELNVALVNKQITIVDLTLKSTVPEKGVDILRHLIRSYVQQNMTDKNEVADSTIAFINRRLMVISSELGAAETDIQGFKQKNNLADMTEQGKMLVASSGQYVADLAKIETQISVTKSLIAYLKDEATNKRVLPSALVPTDVVFSEAIDKYNNLLLERGRKLIGLTPSNPVIQNLDQEIDNARAAILSNLSTTMRGLVINRDDINKQRENAESKIQQVPATERNYLRLARQQSIKQELYLFLMQKSEETAISKTSNIANSRVVDPPRASGKPESPKKILAFPIAMVLGFLFPLGFILLKDFLSITVQTKEDIVSHTDVPILGEIIHNADKDNLVISHNSRSAIAEQFRAMRTNLAFYLKEREQKVILLTSSMSGEGKSFVALNLGNILALSGNKVLLMELDLRKPGLSSKLNTDNLAGFTNYIISDEVSSKDLIQPLSVHPNLFLLGSGPLPPNPAETLMSSRMHVLIEELKLQFDYIIIDAPPVGVVTDAQLLAPHADICLYLVRNGFTRKDQIGIVQELHESGRMEKMGIVVNDLDVKGGSGYGIGYGVYNDPKKRSFLASVFPGRRR